MRVALLSTCSVDVPPRAYGGPESFVAELGAALVARGHVLTVYAPGTSRPPGRLRWCFPRPIWPPDHARELEHAEHAWRDLLRDPPDVVHVNSADALLAPSRRDLPTIATLHHARADQLLDRLRCARPAHLVAISRRQAELVPELAIESVIYHGLDLARYPAGTGRGGYAAFLGRFGPHTAPHVAIDAAHAARVPLKLGGPCWSGAGYDDYIAYEVAPRLEASRGAATWYGELDHARKLWLLQGAMALLVPLGWEDPFSLAMIEAMLVGTPVIAFARGAAPELVEDGLTGYLVEDASAMARRIGDAAALDRLRCRKRARARGSASRMVCAYEKLYRTAADSR